MSTSTHIGTSISRAAELLRTGQLVAIPTETVYGLAADATSVRAVLHIFEVKNRPAFDPLIVHVASADDFSRYAEVNSAALQMASKLSPGPVTFILPKKDVIPDAVTSGHPTVGLRVPNHPMTLDLLSQLDFPLAAPSANPFGYVSPTTAQHVQNQLGGLIPYILDGGPCTVGIESTILDLSRSESIVLRLGGYSLEELEDMLSVKLNDVRLSSSAPHAPGMLQSHYSPGVKLLDKSVEEARLTYPGKRLGALRFSELHPGLPANVQRILSPSGDLTEAASRLFAILREWDEMDVDVVVVEKVPDHGLGRAINDRLSRAAYSSSEE